MFKNCLCIIQAIVLTAALVHNVHLEGLLRDRAPTVFYQEKENAPVINQSVINSQPANSIDVQLLPPIEQEQDDTIQDLNDVLASNNNNPPNHSDALFGGMVEKKTNKKKK